MYMPCLGVSLNLSAVSRIGGWKKRCSLCSKQVNYTCKTFRPFKMCNSLKVDEYKYVLQLQRLVLKLTGKKVRE